MIYNLVIYIYLFGVKVAGLFSAKPAKMVKGHREVFDILRNKIDKNARYIWFHAASLGLWVWEYPRRNIWTGSRR